MSNIPDFLTSHFSRSARELGAIERRVIETAHKRQLVSTDTNAAFSAGSSFGDRLADSIARIGGSWGFISAFLAFLVIWAFLNTILLTRDAFDPYPFIFLNLLLSMLAAIQAPIIMMSQNRQALRDRFEAAKDYEVNLKSELEVFSLHEKIDLKVINELVELRREISSLHDKLDRLENK